MHVVIAKSKIFSIISLVNVPKAKIIRERKQKWMDRSKSKSQWLNSTASFGQVVLSKKVY